MAWLWVLLLALAFSLLGLTGHDPWERDEAYSFGIIYNMVTTGDLVVPTLAADAFMEQPPAYYISAAWMVRLLGGWLPMHDSARLTTGVYLALALLFTGLMARRAWGPGAGNTAVLALIGSLGLMLHGHFMITDIALTAGMAMGFYGLLRAGTSVAWGALWLGIGAGLAFLSKGWLGPGILGVGALVLPLLFGDWRNSAYPRALLMALVIAAPWMLVWPVELYLRDPALFQLWLMDSNLGRLLGTGGLGPPVEEGFWLRTLPWVSFPLLPLALWTLIRHPRTALGNTGVRVALVVSAVGWGVLFSSGTARDLYALPLLAPLAVIAAGGVRSLPGWLVVFVYWLCVLVFGAMALGLWGLWGWGLVEGQPPQWAALGRHLPLDFHPTLDRAAALLALALTLATLLALKRVSPLRPAALAAWPLGLTLVWGLVSLLHLPWLDAAMSYRGVFTALAAQIPAEARGPGCVATPRGVVDRAAATDWTRMRLRESERAQLHYFGGIKARAAASPAEAPCDWLVLEVAAGQPASAVDLGPGWDRVWEGRHPTDRRDTFLLYRRSPGSLAGSVAPGPDPVQAVPPAPAAGAEPVPVQVPEATPAPESVPESVPAPAPAQPQEASPHV
jgi:4-amino-4-deoxy-L-arabinose transferase-like glycosyltransferase